MNNVYYRMIRYYSVWRLDPTGNYRSTGACPTPEEESRHWWRWRQPTTNELKSRDEELGGDGEVEGRALDSMDKLHGERIVFKRHRRGGIGTEESRARVQGSVLPD